MIESTDRPPVIEAEKLTKVFRDFWRRPKVAAVKDLSLSIRPGEVFGLLGPNGSGKSTTIKMILGLLYPTQGRLSVLGRSPRDVRAKARIGYLPEESYLYPYLTSEETLDFYGRLFDIGRRQRRERIDQLLEMIGLQHARRRVVGEFSKGMARRIGLAQALINDPDVVVLDEPTSGLDPLGTRQVKDLIVTLARRGKTVLLSSHLLADVEDVCDRIAILYAGSLQATGSINELLAEATRYQVNLPELEPAALQKVLAAMRETLGTEPDIGHPRRDLEQFFLDVVEKARAETKEQTGARPSKELADYLSAGPPDAAAPDRKLESLVTKPSPSEEDEPAREEPPAGASSDRKAEDADERLKDLLPPSS